MWRLPAGSNGRVISFFAPENVLVSPRNGAGSEGQAAGVDAITFHGAVTRLHVAAPIDGRTARLYADLPSRQAALFDVGSEVTVRVRARITKRVLSGKLHLNGRGRQAQQRGALVSLPVGSSPTQVGDALFRIRPVLLGYYARDFEVLVREHLLVADDWSATYRRYVELQERWDTETAAVFLRPLPVPKLAPGAAPAPPPAPVVAAPDEGIAPKRTVRGGARARAVCYRCRTTSGRWRW